jgi:hypothetical protein
MIVRREGEQLVLVTQADHARLAADLLARWTRHGLPAHPRRSKLLEACREHDNGWWETDAAPACDPEGQPFGFLAVPAPVRLEVWRRGTARYESSRPYVALLATQHGLTLHRGYRGRAGFDELLAELEERRDRLLAELELRPEDLALDYPFLEVADNLSLAACQRPTGAFQVGEIAGRVVPGGLTLDPFPCGAAVRLTIPVRRIPRRGFANAADLGAELGRARFADEEVWLSPPTSALTSGSV